MKAEANPAAEEAEEEEEEEEEEDVQEQETPRAFSTAFPAFSSPRPLHNITEVSCSGAGAGVRADHTVAREEGQEAGRLSRSASSGQAKASRDRVFGAQRVLNTQHTLYQ